MKDTCLDINEKQDYVLNRENYGEFWKLGRNAEVVSSNTEIISSELGVPSHILFY